jgi:Fe-S cluster assembly protein SufD
LDHYAPPLSAAEPGPSPHSLLSEGVELAGGSVSLNSKPWTSQLAAKWSDRGVLFGSLEELLSDHGDLLRPYLQRKALNPAYDRFAALHASWWSGGHLLYVPRGLAVAQPFHALSAMTDGGTDLGRTLVILEEGAEATVLTETASFCETDGGLHCGATEILLAPGANLRFVQLQDWGHGVWHFAHQKAVVARDASLQWTIAALGCRLSKVNQHVGLVGPGANCQVNGVMFTEGKQHLAYHTLQHHEAPYCKSDFLYKAALQDRSRTVWRGMIRVNPGAQKTDGYQRNDNLLLSDRARADSIPGLEIQCDDVRCTHGSTTGKVDEELIFYAMCRGFTRKEAIRMIVSGFFQQIFDRITIESVRDVLAHAIATRVREYE